MGAGARVRAYDPVAMREARSIYRERDDLTLCSSAMEALEGSDGLAIVTEWPEFRSPDLELMACTLRTPVIFDGRNLYDPTTLKGLGSRYYAIGRGETGQLCGRIDAAGRRGLTSRDELAYQGCERTDLISKPQHQLFSGSIRLASSLRGLFTLGFTGWASIRGAG